MTLFDRALRRIEQNKSKRFNCIPFDQSLPRFSNYMPGIQQGRYYLVSGVSGAGKSQLTDELFIFNPWDFLKENKTDLKIKILYYSLEVDAETKMTQWMSRRLFTNYGIRTSIDILQSVGKNRINDNIHMAVMETRAYFEELEDVLVMKDGAINPTGIINDIHQYAINNGKEVKKIVDYGKGPQEVFDHYVPRNSNEYVEVIVDHYSLLNLEMGMDIKHTIEKLSTSFVRARNRYNYIPVGIQQQSGEMENVEHIKLSKLEPSKVGLGETKLTYNDCDLALGIFQPQKHEIKSYRGYNLVPMQDNYRNVNIFKNRYGMSNVNVGMYFDGAVNFFTELPPSDQIKDIHYEAIKNKKPNW